jgi:hypothetical protein
MCVYASTHTRTNNYTNHQKTRLILGSAFLTEKVVTKEWQWHLPHPEHPHHFYFD